MNSILQRWQLDPPAFTTPEELAAKLSAHQRCFLLAASVRPKKWNTIRRHAKIPARAHVHGMVQPHGLVTVAGGAEYMTTLTPLGQRVVAVLREHKELVK